MEFIVTAYSDVGLRKESNEDSLCIRRAALSTGGEIVLAVVCDGMGGLQRGELASAVCVCDFCAWFGENLQAIPALCRGGQIKGQWERVFADTHRRLLDYSVAHCIQLGTTAAVFLACEGRYYAANVGDSRIYERGPALIQLSEDHSLVAREVAMGRITEAEARSHPRRNVLLQCLGSGENAIPTFRTGALKDGCLYFLCSDGYVHEVSPEEMGETLSPQLKAREQMTQALIGMAETCKARGEADNISGVLIRADEGAPAARRGLFRRWKKPETPVVTLTEAAQLLHTEERIP